MKFRGMEDRLNPIAPEGVDDRTLGGYAAIHGRAVGFDASDGSAYTVAIEVEPPDAEGGRYAAYLVFLRWASEGSAIMGHVETGDLMTGASEEEARDGLEAFSLVKVKEILEAAIARKGEE